MLVRREHGPLVSWAGTDKVNNRKVPVRKAEREICARSEQVTFLIILKMNQITENKRRNRNLLRACAEAEPIGSIVELGETLCAATTPGLVGEKEITGIGS